MSPLGRAIAGLRESDARRSAAVQDAAQVWNDQVYRELDRRVLDPIATESRRFAADLAAADTDLQRVHRMLDQN